MVSPGRSKTRSPPATEKAGTVVSPGRVQGGARKSVEEQQGVAALGGSRVADIAQPIGGHAGVRLHDVGLVRVEVGGAVVARVSDPVSVLVIRRGTCGRGDLWRQIGRRGVDRRCRLARQIGRRTSSGDVAGCRSADAASSGDVVSAGPSTGAAASAEGGVTTSTGSALASPTTLPSASASRGSTTPALPSVLLVPNDVGGVRPCASRSEQPKHRRAGRPMPTGPKRRVPPPRRFAVAHTISHRWEWAAAVANPCSRRAVYPRVRAAA